MTVADRICNILIALAMLALLWMVWTLERRVRVLERAVPAAVPVPAVYFRNEQIPARPLRVEKERA